MSVNSNRFGLALEADLTTPTSDQKYSLGFEYVVDAGNGNGGNTARSVYKYIKATGALTQYQPYVIVLGSTAATAVTQIAPITNAAAVNLIGVPQVAFTSGYYGFVQIEGPATAKIGAETYTIGDYLELISAGTTFNVDGTSGSTVFEKGAGARSLATGTLAANISVILLGRPVEVAAS